MPRFFQLVPPEPRPGALVRPRLLRQLVGRWRHRVTSVVGGPGLGRTTLLAQAVAENRLAPRGDDRWVGIQPHDRDVDRFARTVTAAVAVGDDDRPGRAARALSTPDPSVATEAMLARAPTETCLVLDDVHRLPAGSRSAAWLEELVATLPANGHVVLSGRSTPPLRLDRLAGSGGVLELTEDTLRFDEEELGGLAARRGLDPARFAGTGGWPAMVELVVAASGGAGGGADGELTGAYLWEEVLEPLGADRRVLAVLCDLGGGDDDLVSAAVGAPVDLAGALAGVPLIDRDRNGWHSPHALWSGAPGLALDPDERRQLRRRAALRLAERGRFERAFRLVRETGLWGTAPAVLRATLLDPHGVAPARLGAWLAACPLEVRASREGSLASGLHLATTEPDLAVAALRGAADRCRVDGDIDGELTALGHLGLLVTWQQDLTVLRRVADRLVELEASGQPRARQPRARAMAAVARALVADMAGEDDTVLPELEAIQEASLDPVLSTLVTGLIAVAHIDRDEPAKVDALLDRLDRDPPASVRYVRDVLRFRARWSQGRLDEALRELRPAAAATRTIGVHYQVQLVQSTACMAHAHVGDVAAARTCLGEALAAVPSPGPGTRILWTDLAEASLRLAEGDEERATGLLRQALDEHGLDVGLHRRAWRHTLALGYVLLPETRAHWDGLDLQGYLATSRSLAHAVVTLRGLAGRHPVERHLARQLALPGLPLVRAALHVRFAAELALALDGSGRPEGRQILDVYGAPGRAAVRDLVALRPSRGKAARALLAAVPAPPERPTYLAVLGPLVLRRGGRRGDEVIDHDLRRKRLQALVGYLVALRRTTRPAMAAALWPDLDERAAGNNLAVTLSRLLRVLEPWRDSGEPSYMVRQDGQAVSLATGEHLRIDVDEFDAALRAASRAERDGSPAVALDHLLDAVDLYRGDLHAELPEAGWFALDREHYRTRFVTAAIRAGQLLVGQGDAERADDVARRALAVDPWREDAYGVLVRAALANNDRAGARRLLRRCVATLADLGTQPSPYIQHLHHRVNSTTP